MILIVTVILIGLLLINYISKKNNLNQSIGGSFLLTDHQGNSFNSKKINLKKLIYFGYTFCPDICPMDMLKISQIFDQNPNLKKKNITHFYNS